MEKQQHAPIQTPFFGQGNQISLTWIKWFQRLKTRDDDVRRKPHKIYTNEGATLTTHDLGKIILFDNGANDIHAYLPSVGIKDLWCWITLMKTGTGALSIHGADSDYLERYGRTLKCIEEKRAAANLTLQLIAETQWAIIAGSGVWRIMV